MQRRFEDALKKLQADLDTKLVQREEIKEQQRMKKEGIIAEEDTEGGNEADGEEAEQDDLFGDDAGAGMDMD